MVEWLCVVGKCLHFKRTISSHKMVRQCQYHSAHMHLHVHMYMYVYGQTNSITVYCCGLSKGYVYVVIKFFWLMK